MKYVIRVQFDYIDVNKQRAHRDKEAWRSFVETINEIDSEFRQLRSTYLSETYVIDCKKEDISFLTLKFPKLKITEVKPDPNTVDFLI